MNDKDEVLGGNEFDIIWNAIWDMVKQYPRQPDDPDEIVQYDEFESDTSLGVFILGGKYKKKYVSGGFTAEINFRVAYKSVPLTSPQRIDSQAFVGRIMEWLETTKKLPLLTEGRKITKITASAAVKTKTDSGTVYAADAVLEYYKKGV